MKVFDSLLIGNCWALGESNIFGYGRVIQCEVIIGNIKSFFVGTYKHESCLWEMGSFTFMSMNIR